MAIYHKIIICQSGFSRIFRKNREILIADRIPCRQFQQKNRKNRFFLKKRLVIQRVGDILQPAFANKTGNQGIMEKAKKTEIIGKYARKEGDVGSSEVQIALLSARIAEITEHMRSNKKDHSSRRGLMALVNRRKRLLRYLAKENHAKYLELADEFGIRGSRM